MTQNASISTSEISTAGTNGVGLFDFSSAYYEDNTFVNEINENDVIVVGTVLKKSDDFRFFFEKFLHLPDNLRLLRPGERVYFGVNPTNIIKGLSFYVNDCLVSDENNNTFPVIADRCANEFLQPIVESPLAKNLFTMEYTSFAFNSKFLIQEIAY